MNRLFLSIIAIAIAVGNGFSRELKILQWNIWQEGTMIEGGYESIVNEIDRLNPDFVTLSEVRNYHGSNFTSRLVKSLGERGKEYYSFYSYDTGLLSKYPITDSLTVFPENNDHGSIYRLLTDADGVKLAVYTAHLDYLDDAYYNVRGYDGSTWEEIPIPTSVDEVLTRNVKSQRDDAIAAFIKQAEKDKAAGYVVILGGDFNEPSHRDWTERTKDLFDHNGMIVPWTVTTMLEQNGFIDAYRSFFPDELKYPGFTYPSDNPALPPEKITWAPKADERDRIDYIWYSPTPLMNLSDIKIFGPDCSIVRSRRTKELTSDPFILPKGTWPTDHKGIVATFTIPE